VENALLVHVAAWALAKHLRDDKIGRLQQGATALDAPTCNCASLLAAVPSCKPGASALEALRAETAMVR